MNDAAWRCGERRLQGSLKVIQGWPVSNSMVSMRRQRSAARTVLKTLISPGLRLRLVGLVGRLESRPVEIVQIGRLVGGKQRPFAVLLDALHEQIGHPVGRVHVVGAATIVAGVLAQVEKFLDVDMPCLEIGADRALALAALVYRDRGVVGDFEERDDALAFAVGALDVRAEAAHAGPVIAKPAGIF